jgi:hypothetical protein
MTNSAYKLDHCSENLRKTRNKLIQFVHGGVVLDGEQVAALVADLDASIAMALNLEFEVNSAARTQRTIAAHNVPFGASAVVVLSAFRNDPKIIPFPGPRHPEGLA